jgi:hypothetical protein
MSQRTFSIGVFPMVRWKNICSMRPVVTCRSKGSIRSNLPKRAACPGYCPLVCWPSITCAWSCRFSTCAGSFSPRVSATQISWLLMSIVISNAINKIGWLSTTNKLAYQKLPVDKILFQFGLNNTLPARYNAVRFNNNPHLILCHPNGGILTD